METDRVGDADGEGGNLKKNRLSQDPHRLNSNKQAERQDRLYIGIQEKIPAWRTLSMMDPPDSIYLALHVHPTDTLSPHPLCFHFPLFPFFLFSYAHPFIPFVNTQKEQTHRVLIA
jgi:hypothetical protein